MSFEPFLPWLSQWVVVTTVATAVATLGIMPGLLRRSPMAGLVLLALVTLAGYLGDRQFGNPWLCGVVLLPALAWVRVVASRSVWKAWASIYVICMAQNALVYLTYIGCAVLQSSGLIAHVVGSVIWLAQAGSLLVAFPSTFDLLNVLGRRHTPARDRMLAAPEPATWPGCCFQIPASNEPPALVEQVLMQLMQQDYPGRWMIQVIDNNTPDPATWKPIQTLCEHLGARVQFLHLEHWPGFKAGALNEGTRHLPDWVELLAIVDADYLVQPDFLRATVRHLVDPEVAFVQTPQHYREWHTSSYFSGLNFLYELFFATYMPSRSDRNAIIFAGTMGVLRRSCLEAVGYWDEASVTEDAELSLRLLSHRWRGIYDHRSYGAGLMPFTFEGLAKQRFRWAFGTAQLLKKHGKLLVGLASSEGSALTVVQRLCFAGLIVQYVIEVVSFLSAMLLLGTAIGAALGFPLDLPLVQTMVILPVLLIVMNLVRTVWGLRAVTHCTRSQALGALLFCFALSWTTVRACVAALVHQRGVFLRTPKVREQKRWQRALRVTVQESLLGCCFLGMAVLTGREHPGDVLVMGLLAYQAGIYAMAPLCALAAEGVWLVPPWLLGTTQHPVPLPSSDCESREQVPV